MNQEIQKAFILKIILISAVGAGAWYVAVGPQVSRVQDIEEFRSVQINEIQQGESAINLHADQLQSSIEKMSMIRDEYISQLDVRQSSNAHKYLQEAAEAHGLTVSRIEPLRSKEATRVTTFDQSEIKLEAKEFRVECIGPYSEIVGYLDDLANGTSIAKINNFRINPISSESARMIIQVSVYQLTAVPDAFIESFKEVEAKVADAGDTQ